MEKRPPFFFFFLKFLFCGICGTLRHQGWAAGLHGDTWSCLTFRLYSMQMTAKSSVGCLQGSCLVLLSLGHFPSILRDGGIIELLPHYLEQRGSPGSPKTSHCYSRDILGCPWQSPSSPRSLLELDISGPTQSPLLAAAAPGG